MVNESLKCDRGDEIKNHGCGGEGTERRKVTRLLASLNLNVLRSLYWSSFALSKRRKEPLRALEQENEAGSRPGPGARLSTSPGDWQEVSGESLGTLLKRWYCRTEPVKDELSEDTPFQQGVNKGENWESQWDQGSDLSCHRLDAHKGRGRNRKIRGTESSTDYLAFGWLEKLVCGKKPLSQREGPLLSQ